MKKISLFSGLLLVVLIFLAVWVFLSVNTAKRTQERGFSKDDKYVYIYNQKIKGADPDSFEVLNSSHAKDKNSVFSFEYPIEGGKVRVRRLEGVDPATFEIIGPFTKDKNNVYFYDRILPDADPSTFIYLGGAYGKDKNHVFYGYELIKDADPNTFTVSSYGPLGRYAKDKKNYYDNGKVITHPLKLQKAKEQFK